MGTTPYTIQDFIKDNPTYKASYDGNTKTSTVTNALGQSINFASGQKNDAYGISGQTANQSNIVDPNKLKAAFAPAQQQAPQVNAADLINQQAQQQMAAQAAQIQAVRDKQVSDYNAQISATPQTYDPLRNEASYAGAKNLMAVKENMAASGLANGEKAMGGSGDNVTAQTMANVGTQNNVNSLNQQEQNLVNSLKKAISEANSSADMQTLQSNASINAQKLQALITQANSDRDYSLNKSSTDAQIANSNANTEYQKLVNQGYPAEQAAKMAQAVANLKATNLNIEAQQLANKYQPQILQGQIDGQKLQSEYQRLVNAGYDKKLAADLASTYANIAQGNRQLDISQQNANLNSKQFDYQKDQDKQQLDWAKDPNNPDNIYKQAQIDAANGKSGQTYKDYVARGFDMLDKANYNSDTGTYTKMYTTNDVKNWLFGLQLSPEDKAALANDLGLPK